MRRSASTLALVALFTLAILTAQPAPAHASVLTAPKNILVGIGGAVLSVGKTVVCKGLSLGGSAAEGASAAGGAVAGGLVSDGAGAAEGAAAGGAVGGVIKQGAGAVQSLICGSSGGGGGALSTLARAAVGAARAAAVFDLAAKWMIAAAQKLTGAIVAMIDQSTSPQLSATWFQRSFGPLAALGAALALLVTLIALTSAAARRDPSALAATLAGVLRAGVGTGLLIALTTLALQVSDGISADVIGHAHQSFWSEVTHAWGSSGFGGFGSSALAMLMAVIQIVTGVIVWIELAVRNAAIYLAVLFLPVALAASIWPSLSGWTGRLTRLLFLFVILKPVTVIVLAFAGNAALAGLTLSGGFAPAAGTIIAAVTIFALAALAPWALMLIVGADAESAAIGAGFRAAAGHAVGDGAARIGRAGGRIRGSRARSGGYRPSGSAIRSGASTSSGGGGGGGGGDASGGHGSAPRSGGPSSGGSPGPAGGPSSRGGGSTASATAGSQGAVAVAAGMAAQSRPAQKPGDATRASVPGRSGTDSSAGV